MFWELPDVDQSCYCVKEGSQSLVAFANSMAKSNEELNTDWGPALQSTSILHCFPVSRLQSSRGTFLALGVGHQDPK